MASDIRFQTGSSRFPAVVPQNATGSLAAGDFAIGASDFPARLDRSVVERQVISLCVIPGRKSDHRGMRRSPPEKGRAFQAILLDRSREAFTNPIDYSTGVAVYMEPNAHHPKNAAIAWS